jgi:hypothetical protein
MKKICFSVCLALFILSGVIGIKAQSQVTAFIGNWTLDKEKTNAKDLPQKMKDYRMSVNESENVLIVKSQVDGPVEVESKTTTNGGNVSTSGSRTSTSQPLGVSASTGGTSSGSINKITYGGTMAVFFTPPQMNYNLNGEEAKLDIKNGTARIKAKPDKNGKSIQFTTIRRVKTPNGEMEIITRESWKIAEDGKSIKLQRTIETPASRDEITLFLKKVEA